MNSFGEILVPLNCERISFTVGELTFIDEIAKFVNTFSRATDLSDYSHSLSCWIDSVDGEAIEYTQNNGEVAKALSDRMNALQQHGS